MRILVIGGTRFIGVAVVRELFAAGHEIALFHRGETEFDHPLVIEHIHGDRAGIEQHVATFREFAPEVAIDMACMFEADAIAATTALRGIVRRTVVISSIDVYRAYGRMHGSEPGPMEPLPLSEVSPLREKRYPYRGTGPTMDDYDKILVEQTYLADPEMPGTVLRLPAVHGEGDYQRRLFLEVRRFEAERPFIALPAEAADWIWPRGYVENVAHAIAIAATDERAAGTIFNAPVDPALTQRQWIETCGRIAGWSGEVVGLPPDLLPEHLRTSNNFAQSMTVDDGRIRQTLGYEDLVTPEEGMRRAIVWETDKSLRDLQRLQAEFASEDTAVASLGR